MVGALVVAMLLYPKRLESIVEILEVFPSVRPPSSLLDLWILWYMQEEVHGAVHQSVCPCEFQYIMHSWCRLRLC